MKKKIFKKKIFKGMTLVEIIIAIAVLAVMTSVLVAASTSIQKYLRAAGDMNDRVAVQAPVAQAGDPHAGEFVGTVHINIIPTIGNTSVTIPLVGNMYEVYDSTEMNSHDDEAGRGLNMKYINDIETTTGTTTQAASQGTTVPTTETTTMPENVT